MEKVTNEQIDISRLAPEHKYCPVCTYPLLNAQQELDHYKEHIYENIFDCAE